MTQYYESVYVVGTLLVQSSYSFGRILLKLYRCFNHGLKICFLQNP